MNSKTWIDVIPAFIILPLVPFMVAFIPTFNFKGSYYGGGPIREYVINKMEIFIPFDNFVLIKEYFYQATVSQEIMLYSIFALNISIIILWVTFILGGLYMKIYNTIGNSAYQSKRKAIRS